MRKWVGLGLLVWVVTAWVGAASAQQPTMIVGYSEFEPYMFTDENGQATGFSIELLRDAAASNGIPVEFRRFDTVGGITDSLATGELDATVLLGITPGRQELGTFSEDVGTWSFELVFRHPAPAPALDGDLVGLRIAVNEGSAPHRLLMEREGVEFYFSSSIADRLFGLINGSTDAVAGPPSVFRAAARDVGLAAELASHTYVLSELPRAFLIANDRPDLLAVVNAHISDLKRTGQIDRYEQKWLQRLQPDLADRLGANVLTIVGSSIFAILFLAACVTTISMRRWIDKEEKVRSQSMLDALDAARAGIVVFGIDGNLKASNYAFDRAFPKLRHLLRENAGTFAFFGAMLEHGYLGAGEVGEITARTITEMVEDANAQAIEVMLFGAENRIYACLACRLTDQRLALVATDVSELEENNRAIEARTAELIAANKRLDTFAHVAAHDLKSPAASTATLLDWIAEDLNDAGVAMPKAVDETIDRARGLLRRQVALIEDLLSYARSASANPSSRILKPNDRLKTIMDLIEIPEGFKIDFEENLPEVLADPAAFDLVVRNLLGNAIKHHDQSTGHIVLRSDGVEGDHLALVIEDDGPGIDQRFAERVFEPFFRLANQEQAPGSGLGLSVIQNAVQGWGGKVGVSERQPRGTAVRFTIALGAGKGVESLEVPASSDQSAA